MKLKQCFLPLIFCGFSQTVLAGKYSVMGVDDDTKIESFFLSIKKDLKANDANSLSDKLKYPFKVNLGNRKWLKLSSKTDFIANFNKIVTTDFKAALLCETTDDLRAGSRGVMISRGLVYLNNQYHGDIKEIPAGRIRSRGDESKWKLKISYINSSKFAATVAKDCLKKRATQAQKSSMTTNKEMSG